MHYCILIEIRNEFFDLIGWKAVRTIYLLTGYKPEFTQYGPNEVRSVRRDWGLRIFQYGPGNQLINSLLTGYKTFLSCDKTSMSRNKNV